MSPARDGTPQLTSAQLSLDHSRAKHQATLLLSIAGQCRASRYFLHHAMLWFSEAHSTTQHSKFQHLLLHKQQASHKLRILLGHAHVTSPAQHGTCFLYRFTDTLPVALQLALTFVFHARYVPQIHLHNPGSAHAPECRQCITKLLTWLVSIRVVSAFGVEALAMLCVDSMHICFSSHTYEYVLSCLPVQVETLNP